MREIKFRAWDYSKQTMLHWGVIRHSDLNLWKLFNDHAIIAMQYIGYKDKNGVEIYGGDVFSNPNDHYPYYVVVECPGGWALSLPCDLDSDHDCEALDRYCFDEFWTVVGNIYENPELLES